MKKDMFSKTLVMGVILLFIIVGFQPAFANDNSLSVGIVGQQPRGITFYKIFEGGVGEYVQQTTDGGYIIVGNKDACVWLFKTDSVGNKVWGKTLTGEDTDRHWGYCVQQTNDGGYIITGNRYFSISGEGGVWLVKTNSDGKKLWDRTYGISESDVGFFVQHTSDGGYIITGQDYDKLWLIKTDITGNMEWDKTYGNGYGLCVRETSDGGYIVSGERSGIYLFKTDSAGNKEWDVIIETSFINEAYSVQQTSDGGYIITGTKNFDEILFVKIDNNGSIVWDKSFGEFAWGNCVQQTTDGGYIIIGNKWSLSSGDKIWLIKTDSSGDIEWDNLLGISRYIYCEWGQQTSDGGYIILGNTGFDVLLIKTNENGRSRNRAVTNPMLLKILERFPFLQKLIQQLKFRL